MSDYEVGRCPKHDVDVPAVSKSFAEEHGLTYGCQACRDEIAHRPDPATMTKEERAAELGALLREQNWSGFDIVWERTDKLVGRPTYTHELAAAEMLCAEILGEGQVDPVESLKALAGNKPIVVVRDVRESE